MKKFLIPGILVIGLGVGAYFLFIKKKEEPKKFEVDPYNEGFNTDGKREDGFEARKDMEAKRQRLEESAMPYKFVVVDYDSKKKLIGGDFKVEGTLRNTSEYTTYKDFKLVVHFYDKEKELTDSVSEIIHETIPPRRRKNFDFKTSSPKGSKNLEILIRDAAVVKQADS